MKLIRYQYPQSHTKSTSAFDHLFDLSGSSFDRFSSMFDDFFAIGSSGFSPLAADLYEDDANHYLRSELPGLKKGDVDIELENGVLVISSAKSDKADHSESRAHFQRSIALPDGVDAEKITASLQDGVLTVTMPKAAAAVARQITIE